MKLNLPSTRDLSFAARIWARERTAPILSEGSLQLLLLALVSLAIYFLAFVRPYGLLQWWHVPHTDIGKLTGHDPRSAAAYLLAMFTLFALYWLATRRALEHKSRLDWAIVLGGALAMSAVLLFLYPVDAVDIFDNIIRGRITAFYGGNPFYMTPRAVPYDPFYAYTGWYDATSAYGPGWEALAAVMARLAGSGVIANVIVFKLSSILGYAGTVGVIALMLRRLAPERALYGVVLFAWNPLVLYVSAGNGHNDAVMVFFIVLGFYLLARGHFSLAVLAEAAGMLVKFIPALLVPLFLLAALRRIPSWRARISYVLVTGGASLALVALSLIPFWHGGDMISIVRRTTMFTTSLPTWAVIWLEHYMTRALAESLVSRAALLVLAAWVLFQLARLWPLDRAQPGAIDWQPYVRAGLSILMFYLLVANLWFQPWYVMWAVALAALLPQGVLTGGAVLLSLVATWKMPLFDYYIFGGRPLPPFEVRELPLTAGTLGPAWLYFAYHFIRRSTPPRRVGRERVLAERVTE